MTYTNFQVLLTPFILFQVFYSLKSQIKLHNNFRWNLLKFETIYLVEKIVFLVSRLFG